MWLVSMASNEYRRNHILPLCAWLQNCLPTNMKMAQSSKQTLLYSWMSMESVLNYCLKTKAQTSKFLSSRCKPHAMHLNGKLSQLSLEMIFDVWHSEELFLTIQNADLWLVLFTLLIWFALHSNVIHSLLSLGGLVTLDSQNGDLILENWRK